MVNGDQTFRQRKADEMDLPALGRVLPYQIDRDEMWRRRWRREAVYSIVFGIVLLMWISFLIYIIVTLPSAGQTWRF